MQISSCLLAVFLGTSGVLAGPPVEVKDIAAPPSDIRSGRVRMPDPAMCGMSSWSALVPVGEISSLDIGSGKSVVVLFAEEPSTWSMSLDAGAGVPVVESDLRDAGPLLAGSLARVAVVPQGMKHLDINVEGPTKGAIGWMLLADGADEVRLKTYFGSHAFLVGNPLLINASIEGGEFIAGTVHLTAPEGVALERTLQAGTASTASALVELDRAGDWTARTVVRILDSTGVERVRTTQQYIRVERPELTLGGEVLIEQDGDMDGGVELRIPVSILDAAAEGAPRRVAVGCEIWGRDSSGFEVPVCWVARMQELPAEGGTGELGLRMDPRWIVLADVDPASLSLRELRVQGSEGFVPFVHEPTPAFAARGKILVPDEGLEEPVQAMLAGHSGRTVVGDTAQSLMSTAGHVMLISHGYCTDIFPWTTGDFSGDVELFIDFDQNLSHDAFALRFEALGRNFKSMGIAGHSQGGNAAAHLYTFYWSALDWPTGPRRIQGVGVPWQGTALASNIAVLGEIFGVGCGSNYDMTYDGSALWLSFIPSWVREDTWFWTTSFEDFDWWYDYCQIVSDVLLDDPDDGVIERWSGRLDGANNGGHKEAWCHTRLMRDPPQCTDGSRNAELSSEAAR